SLKARAPRAHRTATTMMSPSPRRQTRYSSRSDTVSSGYGGGADAALTVVGRVSPTLCPDEARGLEPLDPRLELAQVHAQLVRAAGERLAAAQQREDLVPQLAVMRPEVHVQLRHGVEGVLAAQRQ